jgi:hypothetical protein
MPRVVVLVPIAILSLSISVSTSMVCAVVLVRDLREDVSGKGEHADARDLLGMLDFKGGKTA